MRKFFEKKYLFLRIAAGFSAGVLIGVLLPDFSIKMKFVGDIYLRLVKMMIVPVIFSAVATGIINAQNAGNLKRIAVKTVLTYIVMFIASSAAALVIAYILRPGLNAHFETAPVFDGEITKINAGDFFTNVIPDNPFKAFSDGALMPVILFTVLFSAAILKVKEEALPLKKLINSFSKTMFVLLDFVMETSPFGVMSLMAFSTAKYGSGIFSSLGKYIFTCYLACAVVFFVVMYLPVFLYTKMPFKKLMKGLYKIRLFTLSTTSSAATLPVSIDVSVNEFKVDENLTKFTLPLGCTINMCGGACSFSVLALFVSDFYSINLSFKTIVFAVFVATVLNMAAPGIPGGGIILGASFLSILGLPFDLMGPIAAFYRLLDMAFTTLNVTGDVTANLLIAKNEKLRSYKSR